MPDPHPFLTALEDGDGGLPAQQPLVNAAIVVIFAYLVPLLTMEINSFRLAVYKSCRRRRERRGDGAGDGVRRRRKGTAGTTDESDADVGEEKKDEEEEDEEVEGGGEGGGFASTNDDEGDADDDDPSLRRAYGAIRAASFRAVAVSLAAYAATAAAVGWATRGLDAKVIAVVIGGSLFLAAVLTFIVSAKVPQWVGVYHQGRIRLVKCSSPYSLRFERTDLDDDPVRLQKLRSSVRRGVWYHFAKFYVIALPFYCGVRSWTIPLSVLTGGTAGFALMGGVFVVHEKYIHRRNDVSFLTILLLSILSSLTFTRGMAWMQVVWKWNILQDEDALMVISFFAWLGMCVAVHALFIWHTLRAEEGTTGGDGAAGVGGSVHASSGSDAPDDKGRSGQSMRRIATFESYSSFVFDPRTHFKDGKCQFSDHPDVEDEFANDLTFEVGLPLDSDCDDDRVVRDDEDLGSSMETPVAEDDNVAMEFDNDDIVNLNPTTRAAHSAHPEKGPLKGKKRPAWCEAFVCFSPEYQQSSRFWKVIVWIKIAVIALSYLLCLYFVIVCIGATIQIRRTRERLPAVQAALYDRMDEGPVCAFDNRGADSDIVTFPDKEAAHAAGYLVVHCGACGACSTWDNLVVEYATRSTMAASANECAKDALFGGGDDALHACLMEPEIGFGDACAACWVEDILCTKAHCAFIFLQSQMINNVGNFAVGEDEVTSATCEEANCEVGQFVPCSGATRRRMNIVSSISRPGDQQCGIVDVKSWEDLFFGSGVA